MTTPYYSDEFVTLYMGDCREVTEWLAADVLVTDPPYGIGWVGATYNQGRAHAGIQNDVDTSVREQALTAWGSKKPAFVFGSFRSEAPASVRQTLVWKKPIDAGVIGAQIGYRTDVELIYLLGEHARRAAVRSSVLESKCGTRRYNPSSQGEGHPHAKPTAILELLIEWTEGTIADPFAGSGSTLLAARNLGRRSIGVELEEKYAELIAKRLERTPLSMFELAERTWENDR